MVQTIRSVIFHMLPAMVVWEFLCVLVLLYAHINVYQRFKANKLFHFCFIGRYGYPVKELRKRKMHNISLFVFAITTVFLVFVITTRLILLSNF